MRALVRSYLHASGKHRPIVPVRGAPGKAVRVIRAGADLAPERAVGVRNLGEDFLAMNLGGATRHHDQEALAS